MILQKRRKYPYLILIIIHTVLLIFTFVKSDNRKALVVLLMSNMGMATIFDYVILSFFRAYSYKPMFFMNKFFDNVTGAILSQVIYVPFSALFITAFKLNWKVKFLFACYFAIVEKIFMFLGIFKSRGWKTRYTFVFIYFFFVISDKWYNLLKKGNPIIKKLTLYNMVNLTSIHSLFMLELSRILKFGVGRFHSWKEQLKVEPMYSIVMATIKTWATLKGGVGLKLIVLVLKRVADQILSKKNIIKIKSMYPLAFIDVFLMIASYFYKKWIDDIEVKVPDLH